MRLGPINTDKEVFVIAEVGNNHEGSYTLAEELVGLAVTAGASAIKFQTFKTELFVNPSDEARFKRMKSFELSQEQFNNLQKLAVKSGLLFISTPLDLESAHFLKGVVTAFKVASGDNNFYPLLEYISGTGKPILLSSGLADIEQLRKSKNLIEEIWKNNKTLQDLAILHCVSSYPVKPEEANISAIGHLIRDLKCTVGYSDHTLGINACVLAVAAGARIIEKHFTIRNDYSDFRDHQLSANPKDFKEMVTRIREAELLLGSGFKTVQPGEAEGVKLYRRSIVAKTPLKQGHKIQLADLMWIRPAVGLLPGEENLVVGKTLKSTVKTGDPILPEMLN